MGCVRTDLSLTDIDQKDFGAVDTIPEGDVPGIGYQKALDGRMGEKRPHLVEDGNDIVLGVFWELTFPKANDFLIFDKTDAPFPKTLIMDDARYVTEVSSWGR